MDNEKRMINDYEVINAIRIDGREIVLAIDEKAEHPFLVADCKRNELFQQYSDAVGSADFLEIATEFTKRINEDVQRITKRREAHDISSVPLTAEDCIPESKNVNLENKIIVIKPEALIPAARTADNQILLVTGGNGCKENARGSAVFTTELFTGESGRWERSDVAGIIKPERMPEWTKQKIADIANSDEMYGKKPSIKDRLEKAKVEIQKPKNLDKPKKNNSLEI